MTTTVRRRGRIKRDVRVGVAYGRFSDKKQGSIPEQIATCEDVAEDFGITLVEHFTDEAVSRSVGDRPALLAMFDYLQAHPEVGFIIVAELERLTAGVDQRAQVTRMCQAADIHIATEDLDEPIDPFDPDAMQKADENAVAANREVLKIRRRVRRTLKQKATTTALLRPPYGIRSKPLTGPDGRPLPPGAVLLDERGRRVRSGQIETHPDEYPWLVKIFEWAAAGKSPLEIRRLLREHNVPTKTGAQDWANRTLTGIIANPLYKGELTWGRRETVRLADGSKFYERREADDPSIITRSSPLGAVIDPAVWQKANDEIAKHAGMRARDKRTFPAQVFDGFVYCGRCGLRMYGRSDGNLAYGTEGRTFAWRYCCFGTSGKYRANVKQVEGFGECPKAWTISEKKILAAMATLALPGGKATVRMSRDGDNEVARRRLRRELTELAAKRKRIGESYEDGMITRDELRAKRDEVDARVSVIEEQLQSSGPTQAPPPTVTVVPDRWARFVELLADKQLPVADRAAALGTVVKRLYVDGDAVQVELVGSDTGLDSRLLRLEHGDGRQDAV